MQHKRSEETKHRQAVSTQGLLCPSGLSVCSVRGSCRSGVCLLRATQEAKSRNKTARDCCEHRVSSRHSRGNKLLVKLFTRALACTTQGQSAASPNVELTSNPGSWRVPKFFLLWSCGCAHGMYVCSPNYSCRSVDSAELPTQKCGRGCVILICPWQGLLNNHV